jgi:predicted dehydrogenase
VVGAGDFGRNHARVYRELADAELIGIVDADAERAAQKSPKEFSTEVFPDIESLAGRVDAVSLAVPTVEHARVGCRCSNSASTCWSKSRWPLRWPKPMQLLSLPRHARGASFRWATSSVSIPAIVAVMPALNRPLYFEVHRLGVFTPRSLDIDVVYDVMIHDLDILLALGRCAGVDIKAIGIPVLTDKVDIAHARLDFATGAVANVTASRVSTERVRKLRFFQQHEYISVDFTRQDALRVRVVEPGPQPKFDFTTLPGGEVKNLFAPNCGRSSNPCARAALRIGGWRSRQARPGTGRPGDGRHPGARQTRPIGCLC